MLRLFLRCGVCGSLTRWWVGFRGCTHCSAVLLVQGLRSRGGAWCQALGAMGTAELQAGQGLPDGVEARVGRADGSGIFWDFQNRLEE